MNNFEIMQFEISKIKGVEHVEIILNDTGYFDHVTQLKPYSFRVIVIGGKDRKVAKKIWMHKPIGALTDGNTGVNFKDVLGFRCSINIERVQ